MASECESQRETNRKEAGDFCPRSLAFKDKKMLGLATDSCKANTWEVEAEGSRISSHLQLQREFKTLLSSLARPCLRLEKGKLSWRSQPTSELLPTTDKSLDLSQYHLCQLHKDRKCPFLFRAVSPLGHTSRARVS